MAAVTLAGGVITALPAQAEIDCYKSSYYKCWGTDPAVTHCADDAYTPIPARNIRTAAGVLVATAEIRWSPTCEMAWTRVIAKGASTRKLAGSLRMSNGVQLETAGPKQAERVWTKTVLPEGGCVKMSGAVVWADGSRATTSIDKWCAPR